MVTSGEVRYRKNSCALILLCKFAADLSPKLTFITGQDTISGYIYGTSSNQNATMVSMDFGLTWNPIPQADFLAQSTSQSFVKSITVPYKSSNESPFATRSLVMGGWGGNSLTFATLFI